MNPFTLLDIATSANDCEIKVAYLSKVKQFAPEHHPEQFQQIQQAYQLLKDEASRVKYQLLTAPEFSLGLIIHHGVNKQNSQRPSASQLLKLLEIPHQHIEESAK
ncbi:MAG: curved DNA-binding protein CbpA [Phenylobacterium sp.]|jgi:curved DNA-binding protein CbpA